MKKPKKRAPKTGIEIIKLGTVVTDRATGVAGAITHVSIELGLKLKYHLQPRIIDPVTGHPVSGLWIAPQRASSDKPLPMVRADIPFAVLDMLGTFAADKTSGMKGMVVGLRLHPYGCVHAILQPAGTAGGDVIGLFECDYRRLENVPELPAYERPSPMAVRPVPSVC